MAAFGELEVREEAGFYRALHFIVGHDRLGMLTFALYVFLLRRHTRVPQLLQ